MKLTHILLFIPCLACITGAILLGLDDHWFLCVIFLLCACMMLPTYEGGHLNSHTCPDE